MYCAGRGIGEAIATELAKAGAGDTVYIAVLIKENCEHVVGSLKKQEYKGAAVSCDLSKFNEVDTVMKKAEKETGKLDIVINNAGIGTLASFLDTTQEEISRLINVNSICPDIIRTPMWEMILDSNVAAGQDRETSWKENLKHFIPLERGDQKAEDIAYAVVFLCSEYADHITGQALNVDGGASMD